MSKGFSNTMKSTPGPSTIAFGANESTISPPTPSDTTSRLPCAAPPPTGGPSTISGMLGLAKSRARPGRERDDAGHEAVRREASFPAACVSGICRRGARGGGIPCALARVRHVARRGVRELRGVHVASVEDAAGSVARGSVGRWHAFARRAARRAEGGEADGARRARGQTGNQTRHPSDATAISHRDAPSRAARASAP